MLKYHVAVCDDEKSDLDGIVQSVQQYDSSRYRDAIQRFSAGAVFDSDGEASFGGICHEAA